MGGVHAAAGDVDDRRPAGRPMDRDVERLAEGLELIRRRRAVGIRGDEERSAALAHEVAGELGRRRRLARALEADHRHDRRIAGQVKRPVAGSEERDQLVVHDLHDLLAGGQALEDVGADGAFADPADEVLDHLEVDVGLEEAQPDLAHGGVDVGLADAASTGQVREGLAQPFAEVVEHGSGGTPAWKWTERRACLATPIGWCTSSGAPRRPECSAWPARDPPTEGSLRHTESGGHTAEDIE